MVARVSIPSDDDALLAQCRIETFRAGGPGGQHGNTTDSGVRITHVPTGVQATSRSYRSQYRNRKAALAVLRERLERRSRREKPRVPTRVPPAQRRKRLEEKRRRGQTKRLRRPPPGDDG